MLCINRFSSDAAVPHPRFQVSIHGKYLSRGDATRACGGIILLIRASSGEFQEIGSKIVHFAGCMPAMTWVVVVGSSSRVCRCGTLKYGLRAVDSRSLVVITRIFSRATLDYADIAKQSTQLNTQKAHLRCLTVVGKSILAVLIDLRASAIAKRGAPMHSEGAIMRGHASQLASLTGAVASPPKCCEPVGVLCVTPPVPSAQRGGVLGSYRTNDATSTGLSISVGAGISQRVCNILGAFSETGQRARRLSAQRARQPQ